MDETRAAIGSHSTATSDAAWDGPANKARLRNDGDAAYYRKAFAWVDPDGDPDVKASYKFIHHEVDGEGNVGAANLRACSAAIAVLNGGRGGSTIPRADRQGVYNHVARHLRDGDQEPPELREEEMNIDELREKLGETEYRFAGGEIELRQTKKGMGIQGIIPFDSKSVEMFGFTETIRASAFDKTLKDGHDVVSSWNHDPNWVLGRRSNDTLKFSTTAKGLEYDVELDEDDPIHRHFARRVERRDVTGSSFTFQTIRDEWKHSEDGAIQERELVEVRLIELGPVSFPAYPKSGAQARALCDVASMRCGDDLDLTELAEIVCRSKNGLALRDDHERLNVWLERLAGLLPVQDLAAEAQMKLRYRKLKQLEARHGLTVVGE